jgi:uncharacterized membrane protein YedE/YeeE
MIIDLTAFAAAFAGGLLIGVASLLLLVATGRIAGISGILGNAFARDEAAPGWWWRSAFLFGLIAAPVLTVDAGLGGMAPPLETRWPVLIVAGLLVGYGTRLGSGCTSGHAVCGLARLSPRSLVATLTFMATAALVVFIRRHWLGA